jgi:hypothetical protein
MTSLRNRPAAVKVPEVARQDSCIRNRPMD